MYIVRTLKSGIEAAIIVRRSTHERLRTTCFRGSFLSLSGNFHRWSSAEDLLRDPEVMRHFLAELDEVWTKQDFTGHSVCIDYSAPVGWESTAPRQNYVEDDLEHFNLNRRSWGLRVKLSHTHLRAPRTHTLTIVYEFKPEDDKAVAVVHSIYPGIDVGDLIDDVTEREQRIFFDFSHPGEL